MPSQLFTGLEVKRVESTPGSTLLGHGKAEFMNVLTIRFAIRKSKDGTPFVAMPAHISKGKWFDDVKIKDLEEKRRFEKAVLDAYEKAE